MKLIAEETINKWFETDHIIYKNFAYIFQNPLWNKDIPKGFSLCPYFWMSWIIGFFALRLIMVPLISVFLIPLKLFSKVFVNTTEKLKELDNKLERKWIAATRGMKEEDVTSDTNSFACSIGILIGILINCMFGLMLYMIFIDSSLIITAEPSSAILATILFISGMSSSLCLTFGFALPTSTILPRIWWPGLILSFGYVIYRLLWLSIPKLFSLLFNTVTFSVMGIPIWLILGILVLFGFVTIKLESLFQIHKKFKRYVKRTHIALAAYHDMIRIAGITPNASINTKFIDGELLADWSYYNKEIYTTLFNKHVTVPSKIFNIEYKSNTWSYNRDFNRYLVELDSDSYGKLFDSNEDRIYFYNMVTQFNEDYIKEKYNDEQLELYTKLKNQKDLAALQEEKRLRNEKRIELICKVLYVPCMPIIWLISFIFKSAINLLLAVYILLKSKKEGVCPYKQFKDSNKDED